jgi:hypothetical protein
VFRVQSTGLQTGESVLCRRTLAFALRGDFGGAIDATFDHLMPDSDDYLRGLLNEYDAKAPLRKALDCESAGS